MTTKRLRLEALAAAQATPREYFTAPPERWQHGQEQAKTVMHRMATRVCSGVETLRRSNAIGDADEFAAERWYTDYVSGIEGVRPDTVGDSGAGDFHTALLARSAAISRHRAIADVIGAGMTLWLVSFLVDDLSFSAMSTRYTPGRSAGRVEMVGRLTMLLQLLTGLYASLDRSRK